MPAETLAINEAVTVSVIRAASFDITSIFLLTLFVILMGGLVFYIKR